MPTPPASPFRYAVVGITAVAALWLYIDRVSFSTLADAIKLDLVLPEAPAAADLPEPSEEAVKAAVKKKAAEAVKAAKKKLAAENPSLGDDPELAPEVAAALANPTLTPAEVDALKRQQWADGRMSYVLGAFFLTYALLQIPVGAMADRFGARSVLTVSIAAWSLVTAATGFADGFLTLLTARLLLGVTEAGAYPAAAGLIKRWARPEERGRFSSIVALGGRVGGALAPWLTTGLASALVGVGLVKWGGYPSANAAPPANWPGVLVLYGACGLIVAGLFWLIVRDHPPGASAAPAPGAQLAPPFGRQLAALMRSRNMWLFGALQFGVNLGWAFLVTLFPTYLNEVFQVPLEKRGPMQSAVLVIGCLGMGFGGVFTDWVRARLGPKLGRSVPIAVALGGCALSLYLVPALPSVWLVVVALGLMAFLVDMHNPSIWSFAQDVGGRNVGAALGFGNMWGNLGAALSPVLLTAVKNATSWNMVFVVGGSAFAAAAVCGLLLDATKPVEPDTPADRP